jgi:hypothetical protein
MEGLHGVSCEERCRALRLRPSCATAKGLSSAMPAREWNHRCVPFFIAKLPSYWQGYARQLHNEVVII